MALLDVPPGLADTDVPNALEADTEPLTEVLQGVTVAAHGANLANSFLGEPCPTGCFAASRISPASLLHVVHVVGVRAEYPMGRIATRRVVASVPNMLASRVFPVDKFPSNPVGAAHNDHAISVIPDPDFAVTP